MCVKGKPMKMNIQVTTNFKFDKVKRKLGKAINTALGNVVVDIANDTIRGSPFLTGNNRRSIKFELGPNGEVAKEKNQAAVYSTSGYGGFLETGTSRMAARPYFKPALDRHFPKLPAGIKAELK